MELLKTINQIPQQAVSIGFMEAGKCDEFYDGWVHKKTAPYTIIAQACEGKYEVGCGDLTIVSDTEEAFLATEGQPLSIKHHAPPGRGFMKARWLHVQFLLYSTVDLVALLALPAKTDVTYGRAFGQIISELLEAKAIGETSSLTWLARRNELGFRALRLLCEIAPPSEAGLAFLRQTERLAPVLSFVRQHISEPLTIEKLAGEAHLSRSRFHTFFCAHMHLSPMDYVKRVRLIEAKHMLIVTDQPVYRIAEITGFPNPYHFSREFKVNTGLTPLKFRRQQRAMDV